MQAIKVNGTEITEWIYQLSDSDLERDDTILVDTIPEMEVVDGFIPTQHYSVERGFWCEQIPEPITPHEEIPPTPPDYQTLVNAKIRARYTVEQELSMQRQRDDKPEEFAEYYAFCEECKAAAKREIEEFNNLYVTDDNE